MEKNMPPRKTASTTTIPLILDLIGPFVVHFCKGKAKIHAPICDNHHANLLTDTNDIPLFGLTEPGSKGYVYHFESNKAPHPASTAPRLTNKTLLVMDQTITEIPEGHCHLLLEVPWPNKVVPLLPEAVWIHQGTATVWGLNEDEPGIVNKPRARGLRFIYRKCSGEPKICQKPDLSANAGSPLMPSDCFKHFSARTLGYDEHYSMTIRFASNQVIPDDYHQDAYCCFRKMRDLISDIHCWRVDFDDSTVNKVPSTDNVGGPHPKDCGASILLVKDIS
jgi:hypothetical protein